MSYSIDIIPNVISGLNHNNIYLIAVLDDIGLKVLSELTQSVQGSISYFRSLVRQPIS